MKLRKLLYLSSFAVLAITAVTGCKKEDFNINTNPDEITGSTATYSDVFPAALQSTSTIVDANWKFMQNWLGYWARSGDYQAITDEETYTFTNDFQVAIWNNLYANANNYDYVLKNATAAGAGIYAGVARIMKAHAFQMLVDVYGNVPYTQALQGNANRTPKYDKGIDIYKDLFRQLDTAITVLKDPVASSLDANPNIAETDFAYKGDKTKWIKFANTLKLRMLVHVHAVPGFDIAGEMAKITTEGFLGTGESAHINPGFTPTKPNPYYRAFVANENGTATGGIIRANAFAIDYYKWNGDPRIDRFYKKPTSPVNAVQRGVAYGQPANSANAGQTLSTVDGPGILPDGASSRAWILTSVESMFLQAEARQRGWITTGPSAQTLYENAITESFIWLGVPNAATAAATYRTNNATYSDVDFAVSTNKIWTIMMQKWFALNAVAPFEVWSDYRRININGTGHMVYGGDGFGGSAIGFDEGPPISVWPANTRTEIPVRLLYPQNEYNYNPTNVAAEGNVNVFSNRVFWDVN